jgi:ubiquinone/menaquinone biosynthesis C-methylase UbiE
MKTQGRKGVYSDGRGEPTYLDIQAEVGITKHMGGYAATETLHCLCHLHKAREVLEVGCGIGVGPASIARRYPWRVVASDISSKMLSWAQQRARREGVADRITFRQGDIRNLPFEDNRFDAVLVESVLAFVEDKQVAIRELLRVARPGGYVGLSEGYWRLEPPPEMASQAVSLGTAMITEAEWRAVWEAMPLEARSIETHDIDLRREIRDLIGWVGWHSILPACGRMIKLLVSDPQSRDRSESRRMHPLRSLARQAMPCSLDASYPRRHAERPMGGRRIRDRGLPNDGGCQRWPSLGSDRVRRCTHGNERDLL